MDSPRMQDLSGSLRRWLRWKRVALGVWLVVLGLHLAGLPFGEEVQGEWYLRWGLSWQGVMPEDGSVGHWEQLVTHAFLHGNYWHLILNGLALWVLGNGVERVGGWKTALKVLGLGVVLGGLAELGLMGLRGSDRVLVGISGGLAAWFGWLVRVDPEARLRGFGVRLKYLFAGWLAFEIAGVAVTWRVGDEVEWIAANGCHVAAGLAGWCLGRGALGRLPTLEDLRKERARREGATGS